MLNKLTALLLLTATLAQAGLPPTTMKGQTDSAASTTFNLQVPARQATRVGGVSALLETGNKNLLADPGFEGTTITTKWTASGGTLASESTAANVGAGSKSGSWDPSAASQTLLGEAQAIPAGLYGRNGYASCLIKTASTDVKIQAYDGTNVLAEQTITGTSNFVKEGVNFIFPVSGNIQLRLIAASNSAILYADDCYVGDASNVGFVSQVTDWISNSSFLTLTSGFGTVTNTSIQWRRIGNELHVRGALTLGTVAAGVAYFDLPSGYVIDTGKIPSNSSGKQVGEFNTIYSGANTNIYSGNIHDVIFFDGSDTNTVYVAQQAGSNVFTKSNSSSILLNNQNVDFHFSVPIVGWGAESAIKIDEAGQSWSGYHANNCALARTNAAYGDPTADATCTFTERTNRNFGTVTSSGSVLPNIVFTPKKAGRYFVCALVNVKDSAGQYGVRLWDGTTEIAEASGNINNQVTQPVCGIYNAASTASTTLSLQTRSVGGTVTIGPEGTGGGESIEWSIFSLDQVNSPILAYSINTPNSSGEKFARAEFSSAGVISNESGDWVSADAALAASVYTITLVGGTFSATPVCVASINGATTGEIAVAPASATSVLVRTFSTAGAAADRAFSLVCMGPR